MDLFGNETEVKEPKVLLVYVVTRDFSINSKEKLVKSGEVIKIFDEIEDEFGCKSYYGHYNGSIISVPEIFKRDYMVLIRKEKVNG